MAESFTQAIEEFISLDLNWFNVYRLVRYPENVTTDKANI